MLGEYAERMPPEVLDAQREATPLGRLATADDVAAAVSAVVGDLPFTPGSIITVDGGRANDFLEFLVENQIAVAHTRARSDGERVILSINECGVEHRGELLGVLRQFDGIVDVVDTAET